MTTPRLILLHKQKTSGRVRFLRLPGGMLAFAPLPVPASLREDGYAVAMAAHPVGVLREAEKKLGLPMGSIEPAAEFQAWVDTPEGDVAVLLASFASIDPPFEAAAALGGKFIAITEARGLPELELQLLRRVYEYVLG